MACYYTKRETYLSSNFALTSVLARFRLLESFNTSLFTTDLLSGTSTEYLEKQKTCNYSTTKIIVMDIYCG